MIKNNQTHASYRKARTRTLIQLGGLFEKSGLMETFDINVGDDLQMDLGKKENAYAVLGALAELKFMMNEEEINHSLLVQKGKKVLRNI